MAVSVNGSTQEVWWKDGVFYQIWPASYKDGNGDGMGDIVGIIETLDYLKDLGVDTIWVSPMYQSPQKDMGYDISDYEAIDPMYGSVEDAEKLIKGCHDRGMRIIFDLVVNHTSDQHEWFKQSRSSKDDTKRDWYFWRPPKYVNGERRPPNNWRAYFGGSAWQWDEHTQEYYLHLFVPEQPDLNWENNETREAIYNSAVKFWLDKGIDGFRVDTVNLYSKPIDFPDGAITDPSSEYQLAPDLWCNGPRMHEFLRELNDKVLSQYDCCTVGELPSTPNIKDVLRYVSAEAKQLNMVFQFDVVNLGQPESCRYEPYPIHLPDLKAGLARMQTLCTDSDGWATAFLENHDQARSISRFTTPQPTHHTRAATLLSLLLSTLSGTLFLYQGQELGMTNAPRSWAGSEYKDVETQNYLSRIRSAAQASHPDDTTFLSAALEKAMDGIAKVARDHARTPMQWDSSPHAGFTKRKEGGWMRVNDNFREINVERQRGVKGSVLEFWRGMISMRKEWGGVFIRGRFVLFEGGNERTVTFGKIGRSEEGGKGTVLVVLNFSEGREGWRVPVGWKVGRLLVGNVGEGEREEEEGVLGAWEGRVYEAEVLEGEGEVNGVNGVDGHAVNGHA